MTDTKARQAIEIADEFSQYFPDQSNNEIMDHINFVMETDYNLDDVIGRACIAAYDHGIECAYSTYRAFTGVNLHV